MGFADNMRVTATNLMTKLGNPCILTKVTKGVYDPTIGKAPETQTHFNTYSAGVKKASIVFGDTGINTNLSGFSDNKVIVPWIGEAIDETWLYNGNNIVSISPTETQGLVIIYTIELGEK